MLKQRTRRFGGKIYRPGDFSPSKRMASILAKNYREDGYLARITMSSGKPVFYEVWIRRP